MPQKNVACGPRSSLAASSKYWPPGRRLRARPKNRPNEDGHQSRKYCRPKRPQSAIVWQSTSLPAAASCRS
eukprot:scaffold6114_cov60-Phaeocystis_antarctica.AAC.5